MRRVGGEAQQAAAGLALGHCSAEAHALLFDELQGLADEFASDRTKARPSRTSHTSVLVTNLSELIVVTLVDRSPPQADERCLQRIRPR